MNSAYLVFKVINKLFWSVYWLLHRIGTWRCWLLWREENRGTQSETLGVMRNSTHTWHGTGIERGPHWWEACALTTAPSLLPKLYEHNISRAQCLKIKPFQVDSWDILVVVVVVSKKTLFDK